MLRFRGWRLGVVLLSAVLPLWGASWALVRYDWAPIGDEALISWRSWDILHGHGPLVGESTQASVSLHAPVFDPGPMLYWVLTGPTALWPNVGPAVAVAMFSSICLVLAIVAVRQAVGLKAAWCVAAAAMVLQWSLTAQLATAPVWNCYAPLLPFASLLCLGWTVAAGRIVLWPAMVVIGSFASQSHLMYAVPSFALIVTTPILFSVGQGTRPPITRPSRRVTLASMAAGVVAGLLCWIAPLIEQSRHSPGNLTLLWRSTAGNSGATIGLRSALRHFGQTIYPFGPLWLQPPHQSGYRPSELAGHTVLAVVGLVGLALVAGLAPRTRPALSALASVTLIADLAAIYTVGRISQELYVTIDYIQLLFWPLGIATAGALVLGLWHALHAINRWRASPVVSDLQIQRAAKFGPAVTVCGIATAGILSSAWQAARVPAYATIEAGGDRQQIIQVAKTVADRVGAPSFKDQRVVVDMPPFHGPDGLDGLEAQVAISYQLRVKGWLPTSDSPIVRPDLAPVYAARSSDQRLQFGDSTPQSATVQLGDIPVPGSTRTESVWLLRPSTD
jgi:hypothetical protein